MTSSDGFCSALSFAPGELGLMYQHSPSATTRHTPTPISIAKANSAASTPQPTPVGSAPLNSFQSTSAHNRRGSTASNSSAANPTPVQAPPHPSPSPSASIGGPFSGRPASPARSMSASSIATEASFARVPDQNPPPAMNNPTPSMSSMPSLAAAGSSNPGTGLPLFTPPQTPAHGHTGGTGSQGSIGGASTFVAGVKRESNTSNTSESEDQGREKRRRIAPTPVTEDEQSQAKPPASVPPAASQGNGS